MRKSSLFSLTQDVIVRMIVLLAIVLVVAVVWEYNRNRHLQSLTGIVRQVADAQNENGRSVREYRIEYTVQGKRYIFVARASLVERMGILCCLTEGDKVALMLVADRPWQVMFDSFSSRYPLVARFALLAVFFIVYAIASRLLTHSAKGQ